MPKLEICGSLMPVSNSAQEKKKFSFEKLMTLIQTMDISNTSALLLSSPSRFTASSPPPALSKSLPTGLLRATVSNSPRTTRLFTSAIPALSNSLATTPAPAPFTLLTSSTTSAWPTGVLSPSATTASLTVFTPTLTAMFGLAAAMVCMSSTRMVFCLARSLLARPATTLPSSLVECWFSLTTGCGLLRTSRPRVGRSARISVSAVNRPPKMGYCAKSSIPVQMNV